jgi:hypothetical protein
MTPDRAIAAIEAACLKHAVLTWKGYGSPSDDEVEFHASRGAMTLPWQVGQFLRAVEWLEQVRRTTTVSRRRTSYGWKHVAERWHMRRKPSDDYYIGEGMFIAAAIHLDFVVRRVRYESSVLLNISSASDD